MIKLNVPNKKLYAQFLMLLIMLFVSNLTLAHDVKEKDNNFKFSQITCWDLLLLTEEQRPHALTMVYGYQAGMNGTDIQDGKMIEHVLKKTGKICENEPDSEVLILMSKVLKRM